MPGKVEEAWIEAVSTPTIAMPLQHHRAHIVVLLCPPRLCGEFAANI